MAATTTTSATTASLVSGSSSTWHLDTWHLVFLASVAWYLATWYLVRRAAAFATAEAQPPPPYFAAEVLVWSRYCALGTVGACAGAAFANAEAKPPPPLLAAVLLWLCHSVLGTVGGLWWGSFVAGCFAAQDYTWHFLLSHVRVRYAANFLMR